MNTRILVTLRTEASDRSYFSDRINDAQLRFAAPGDVSSEDLAWAQIVVGNVKPPSRLLKYANIRWVHSPNVGLEAYAHVCGKRRDLLVTNCRGIVDDAVAEHAVALLLAMTRALRPLLESQQSRIWRPADRSQSTRTTIAGKHAHVLGYGSIAQALIERLLGLSMVVSVYRRKASGPDVRVKQFLAQHELPQKIHEADVLFVLLPETTATRGLVNDTLISAMKPGARLINVGRGSTVDEQALITAVRSGHLAGAALDVFSPEPPADDSPLWDLPDVIISPHIAGRFDGESRKQIDGFLARYKAYNDYGAAGGQWR